MKQIKLTESWVPVIYEKNVIRDLFRIMQLLFQKSNEFIDQLETRSLF